MRRLALVVVAVVVFSAAGGAAAQEPYPTRPVTIVNPFPPGGIADLTARPLAAALERILKQPFVVANKPGAAGAVGTQSAAVAKPDGYTLLVALVSISSTPEVDKLFGRAAIYTRDQFVGIARLNADPPLLVVNGPWKTLKELVDDARKRPGEITYASSGPYGASHLPIEMLLNAAGVKMRHLPTTGGAPATTAVLGGHAQLWASPPALAVPHIQVGKMRPLASYGATRLAAFPDVPTLKELGYRALRATGRAGQRRPDPARRHSQGRAGSRAARVDGKSQDADRLPGRRRVQDVLGRGRPADRRGDPEDRKGRR